MQTSGLSSLGFTYNGLTNTFEAISAGMAGGISFTDGKISLDNPSDFTLATTITPANKDSDTRVLSAPRIVVSHNEEGIINVSRSQPIITGSTNFNNSPGTSRSSVEYRDIGIKLTVTPLIGADGTVQMVIEQSVENVVETIIIDDNPQPIIGVREATSTVSVKDGEIVVLGGLQENTGTDSNDYFPIIGRLPLIRNILGGSAEDHKRTEIIIFIRPTVLQNTDVAFDVSKGYIEAASETEVIEEYINTNSTNDIYLEDSKFEDPDKPKGDRIWPRFFRR